MGAAADFSEDGDTLRFTGDLSLATIGDLPQRLRARGDGEGVRHLDLSAIDRIDTVGAWVVHRFAHEHNATIEGLDPEHVRLLEHVERSDQRRAIGRGQILTIGGGQRLHILNHRQPLGRAQGLAWRTVG